MFNKTISSLLVLSMLHTNVAFCMEGTNADDERPKSPPLRPSTKTEEEVNKQPQSFLEKCKSLSKEDFVAAMWKESHLVYTLDAERRTEMNLLIHPLLEDDKIAPLDRINLFFSKLTKAPPVATLKQLLKEVTEQSVELNGYQISRFIEFANNDPEVVESAKALLKTPELVMEATRYLSGDTMAPLVDLILAVARNESQSQAVRVAALRNIHLSQIDEVRRGERDRLIVSLLDKETVPLHERLELLWNLQEAPPAATLKQLLKEVTEQSVELSGYKISTFIKFANNDPEVIENAKALLKTPELVMEAAKYLTLVDLLLDVASNETQPQEVRVTALHKIHWSDIKIDEVNRKERDRLIVSLLDKETVPLHERLELLGALQEAPPEETLLKLAEALEPEQASKVIAEGGTLEPLLDCLTESSHPLIKAKLERYFLENPKEFFDNHKEWLREHLQTVEGSKKELILEAIFKLIQPTPNSIKTKPAKLILKFGANEKYRGMTVDVLSAFVKTGEAEQYEKKSDACDLILKYSEDPVRKKITIQWLFKELEKEISAGNIMEKVSYTWPLLREKDSQTRQKALELLDKLISHPLAKNQDDQDHILLKTYARLRKIEGSERLQEKILTLLKPRLEEILSSQIELKFGVKLDYLLAFFLSSDERSRQRVYDHLKSIIIENKEDKASQAAVNVIHYLGEEHPWSQEVTQLMVGRENLNSKNNSFVAYRELLAKTKEPAVHNLSTASLPEWRKVRFSLKALQTPRRRKGSPVDPAELVRLTKNLIEEMGKYPEEVSSLVGKCTPDSLIKTAENPFLKGLLLNDSPQNAGIRFKLHRILNEAKSREGEPSSEGLSPTSTLMLQLLVNVRTCSTGEEDGVDVTHRLIDHQRGASEEVMTIERRQEKSKETIMEELRQMRESLLNGDGPVVKHFAKEKKIEEPPHQAKYLRNLLLDHIGMGFEGEKLSFDLNGGLADKDLREAPLQEVLDVFHSLYTPEKAIGHFLEAFNTKRLPGTFMTSVIGEDTLSKNYELYYDMDEDKWKPHAIVDLFLRLGVLEEVS